MKVYPIYRNAIVSVIYRYESKQAVFLNSAFCTFPIALCGKSSLKIIDLGDLYDARRSRQKAIKSGPETDSPRLSTTTAVTRSPHSRSGQPMTAHAATDGCSANTRSTSGG